MIVCLRPATSCTVCLAYMVTAWITWTQFCPEAVAQELPTLPAEAGLSMQRRSSDVPQRKLTEPLSAAGAPDPLRFARVNRAAEPVRSQGQVWREYDLRTYVGRVRGAADPLQNVVDWILRETGTDRWFGDVPGMLCKEGDRLRVYHLPEVHGIVEDVVERFANPAHAGQTVSAQLMTVESVNWRTVATPLMQPLSVRTAGVEAWVLSRENAALLMAHLRQRVDFREHNSSSLQISHGQSHTIERWQPRQYPQSMRLTPGIFPGFQVHSQQIREGYALKITPLAERSSSGSSTPGNLQPEPDEGWMQVVVQVQMEQIERLASLWLDVPAVPGQPKRVEVQVPQVSTWQVQERFRWPRDQVLLVSRGMVGMPGIRAGHGGLPSLAHRPGRVDALLLLACYEASGNPGATTRLQPASRLNYHDRY